MDPSSLSVEQEASANIVGNKEEASPNIVKNERKNSEDIEENIVKNEREDLKSIEKKEREDLKSIEKNEREASGNIEENEQEDSENIVEDERGFVEPTNLKNAAREIVACIVAASFHIAMGISISHPVILNPYLKEEEAKMNGTEKQNFWTSNLNLNIGWISISALLMNFSMDPTSIQLSDNLKLNVGWISIGALLTGSLIDKIGRLRTLQIGAILCVIGWILIVITSNASMLLVGYFLSRIATALITSSAMVYITEMARPKLRGSMICFGLTIEFFGLHLYSFYVNLSWRLITCLNIIYMVVLIIAMQFLMPESSVWLVSKGRIDDAKKSLEWLYKNETSQGKTSMADLQFNTIMKENKIKLSERRSKHGSTSNKLLDEFLKPTGWKPMVILFLLFSFQQFSGNGFYVIHSLQKISACVGKAPKGLCLIMTHFLSYMVSIWLLWRYKRRPLCIISSLGMTVCIVSQYFTLKMKNEDDDRILVICSFYVCTSNVGMSIVPWTMTAELFPTEIRGIAHSISYSIARLLMYAVYEYYRSLQNSLAETYDVHWCFIGVSMGAVVFVLLMLPETHGKKLSEIEEYFQNNFLALGAEAKDEKRRAKRRAQKNAKSIELCNLTSVQSLA